jgi:AGCS family alanine or glycine:cation symporter
MDQLNKYILLIDSYFGSAAWFPLTLLATGIFFTIYLGFPQIRNFKNGWKVISKGGFSGSKGLTSPFQALSTALSGTVGTGNIGGVAMAIFIGGPAALFWMWVTAFLGMTTKFVEVTLSHKYRKYDASGSISGGPMIYMEKGLNMKWLGLIFAFCLLVSTFGSGNMPQIDNISSTLNSSFGFNPIISSLFITGLVGLVIIGGINRIASFAGSIVPTMALIYVIGSLSVLIFNYSNILPSLYIVIHDVFNGTAIAGGFLGASFSTAFTYGVARGLYSNEAGQGSSPIVHATSNTEQSIEEGFVSILEPFVDTLIICTLTGLVILASGVWTEKYENEFERTSAYFISPEDSSKKLNEQINAYTDCRDKNIKCYEGELTVQDGILQSKNVIFHNRSIAENVLFFKNNELLSGQILIENGLLKSDGITLTGYSLVKSAVLTSKAFNKGFFGGYGEYIVSIGLLLFAFSTMITWSYYGDRCTLYLFGENALIYYRVLYLVAMFIAGSGLIDTEIIWNFALITVAASTLPNLIGMFLLRKEMKLILRDYLISK